MRLDVRCKTRDIDQMHMNETIPRKRDDDIQTPGGNY